MVTENHNGFALVLAWPDTMCKQTGAWYDSLMRLIGFNKKGYYRVGHAAIVLIDDAGGMCHYYDFGRYHAPHGCGRVRSARTDHDLSIHARALIDKQEREITNIADILSELHQNTSTHGDGAVHCAIIRVDVHKAIRYADRQQRREIIAYGPFALFGTNCSRFVNSVLRNSRLPLINRILLFFPWMLTPTPLWNLAALRKRRYVHGPKPEVNNSQVYNSDVEPMLKAS